MFASLTRRFGFLDSLRLVSLQNIVEQKYAATTPTVADFTTIGAKSQVRVSRILQRFIGHPVLENEFVKKLFVQKSVKVRPAPSGLLSYNCSVVAVQLGNPVAMISYLRTIVSRTFMVVESSDEHDRCLDVPPPPPPASFHLLS